MQSRRWRSSPSCSRRGTRPGALANATMPGCLADIVDLVAPCAVACQRDRRRAPVRRRPPRHRPPGLLNPVPGRADRWVVESATPSCKRATSGRSTALAEEAKVIEAALCWMLGRARAPPRRGAGRALPDARGIAIGRPRRPAAPLSRTRASRGRRRGRVEAAPAVTARTRPCPARPRPAVPDDIRREFGRAARSSRSPRPPATYTSFAGSPTLSVPDERRTASMRNSRRTSRSLGRRPLEHPPWMFLTREEATQPWSRGPSAWHLTTRRNDGEPRRAVRPVMASGSPVTLTRHTVRRNGRSPGSDRFAWPSSSLPRNVLGGRT
jgi:hypothetical protein